MKPFFSRTHDAYLFDMDGTILDSLPVVERIWSKLAVTYGHDPLYVLSVIHGVRAIDNIRRFAPEGTDCEAVARQMFEEEMEDMDGITALPGAVDFLSSLPSDRWAIVTSAEMPLAKRRVEAAGLPLPKVIIGASDVANGKPFPDCFQLGAQRLGFSAANCLVFEDAPAGMRAGLSAGADVMLITGAHRAHVETTGPKIADYRGVAMLPADDGRLQVVRVP
ncbi:sugar-phosphatase [Rhizobium sp. RU20A]|uniref:HAD-IA family hydrolase n=1 Tax=Rhizobium sp. RU20A TaxID=1907412 RepID=UPI0009550385|nr:HAD-IA family hydrolase [Rhizobium sp. RU20A]SIQ60212.1 sugar-phosphatase [Rhizobium sp. RU20A]